LELAGGIESIREQITALSISLELIEERRVKADVLKQTEAALTAQLHVQSSQISTAETIVQELRLDKQKLEQAIAEQMTTTSELRTHHVMQLQTLNDQVLQSEEDTKTAKSEALNWQREVESLKEQLKNSEQQVAVAKSNTTRLLQEV